VKAQSGFSFLELIVVVGLLGIVAAFSISPSDQDVSVQKMVSQAQENAVRLSGLIATAKITCDSKSIAAYYYRLKPSNTLLGSLGVGVQPQTSAAATRSETLVTYALTSLVMSCPATTSYVTSDGNIFTESSGNFDLIISSSKKPNLQTRVLLSKLGYPRIYARDTNVASSWNEIRQ
jgi:prepilin-type N-terminal cleavage/methylation domain-containing protein